MTREELERMMREYSGTIKRVPAGVSGLDKLDRMIEKLDPSFSNNGAFIKTLKTEAQKRGYIAKLLSSRKKGVRKGLKEIHGKDVYGER
jgi:hypothetical protein